jgi:hypothetical protein
MEHFLAFLAIERRPRTAAGPQGIPAALGDHGFPRGACLSSHIQWLTLRKVSQTHLLHFDLLRAAIDHGAALRRSMVGNFAVSF